jgi:hypothetical protein
MKARQSASLFALIAMAISLTLWSSAAQATLLFSDSFSYPVGSLAGNGPPPGSPPGQSAWISLNFDPQVTTPGLVFPSLHTAGNAATLADSFNNGDAAGADLSPVGIGSNSVVWIGVLITQEAVSSFGYAVVTFNEGFGLTAPGFGVLLGENVFGIDNENGSQAMTTISPSTDTVWLVIKLDFNAGQETLYVNPVRGGALAKVRLRMTSTFQNSGFSRIILKEGFNSGAYTFDELRVGTTLADIRR